MTWPRFRSFFDVLGIETSLPQEDKGLEHQRTLYQWQPKTGTHADKYPPHLNLTPSGPPGVDNVNSFQIFDAMRLLDTGFVLAKIVPDTIKDFVFGYPDQGSTMVDILNRNQSLRAAKKNIYTEPNIGDRADYYSDEVRTVIKSFPLTFGINMESWIKSWQCFSRTLSEVYRYRSCIECLAFKIRLRGNRMLKPKRFSLNKPLQAAIPLPSKLCRPTGLSSSRTQLLHIPTWLS